MNYVAIILCLVQGSTGRPKGKVGISWNTVNEYICADVSSDVSMNEIKRKAQTYAREIEVFAVLARYSPVGLNAVFVKDVDNVMADFL